MTGPVPFELDSIDHVVLRARNSGALIRFYQDVLGCRLERELPELSLSQLRAGRCLIDILAEDGQPGGRNLDHFCLRIHPFDPDAIAAHLQRHGANGSAVRRVYGAEGFGPSIYVDDPEGNTVELKGPAEMPPQPARPLHE